MRGVLALVQTLFQVALTGAGCAGLAVALHLLNLGVDLRLTWWIVLPATPLLYAAIVFSWAPKGAGRRAMIALGGLWLAHTYVGLLTALLLALLDGLELGTAVRVAFWRFAPATLLEVFAALLMFRPFRDFVAPPPRPSRRAAAVPGAESIHARAAAASAVFTVAPSPRPARPAAAPTSPQPSPGASSIEHASRLLAARAAAPAAETKPAVAVTPVAAASPVAEPDVREAIDETDGDATVRIPFAKVAEQLPPDAFAMPIAGVGARLVQPGELLVPRRLVMRQLGEGVVTVPWDVIEGQFPADVLVARNGDMASRIAGGHLLLPLDEIVRQLPTEIFKLPRRQPDIPDIESFPLPFQPPTNGQVATAASKVSPVSGVAPDRSSPPVGTSAPVEPKAPEIRSAAPEMRAEPEARLDARAPGLCEERAVTVAPAAPAEELCVEAAPVMPAPAPVGESLTQPVSSPTTSGAEGAPLPSPSAPDVLSAPIDGSSSPIDEPHPLGTALARLTGLHVDAVRDGDLIVFRAVAPGEPSGALEEIARRLRPLLDAGARGVPLDQLTLRTRSAAVVLTRIDAAAGARALLAAGTHRGAGLAWLEQSCRQAAVADAPTPAADRERDLAALPAADVIPAILAPEIERLAASLVAFGTTASACFRRAAPPLELYVFAGPGHEAQVLARFAAGVCAALDGETDDVWTEWISVTGRRGAEQVTIQRVAATLAGPRVLVAAGTPERPGRARLELERAARVLGTGRS